MLGIVTACEPETAVVRRCLRPHRTTSAPVGRLWHGRIHGVRVVLMRCGMGPERAAAAASWLTRTYPLEGLLNVGFAGGVHPSLTTGDALVAQRLVSGVVPGNPAVPATFEEIRPDERLGCFAAAAATRAALRSHRGTLLSVTEVAVCANMKQALGIRAGALAIDMEAFGLGRVAAVHSVPFMVLRTIFDTCDDEIPPRFSRCLTADGTLHYGHLVGACVVQPRLLASLVPLRRKARVAGRHLERWLETFFTLLGQAYREEHAP
jgi:adenosylhomocysteine nucleosidase